MHRGAWGMAVAAGLLSLMASAAESGDDPLLRPIAPDFANQWLTPVAPGRVFGNTYSVGFGGLSVALIDTGEGLILVDGAVPQAVPAIEANIRALGFRLEDVKLILSTEPHYDHAGGLAALARDTGATVVAGTLAAPVLAAGQSGADDPQRPWLPPFPAVRDVRAVADGETIRLGDVTVTALATPGHTAGSVSWTWQSCEAARCHTVVFASSLNPVAPDEFRFSAPANRALVETYGRSFARMRGVPCDLLITAHPDFHPGETPDGTSACAAYAEAAEARLEARLHREASGGGA